MARQPADKATTTRQRPISRQAIWEAIRARATGFTLFELERATGINHDTVRSYVKALRAGGFVAVATPSGRVTPAVFTLARDIGREAPRLRRNGEPVTQGASREQMWRTMKIAVQFTAADLAVQASLPDSAVSEVDAKDYCKRLCAAGYLVVLRGGVPREPSVFRFVSTRDTGPLPPMVQRLKTVFDPNLNRVVWQEEPRP